MDEEIKVGDESGDKKYFTMLPNYILNHSTANDQALYMQMKKVAGENGRCFVSERKLMEKLGIGEKALKKSIQYLLKREWIKGNGYVIAQTAGGMQKVKAYKIVDIWKENVSHYQGASESVPLQGASESSDKVLSKGAKGASESGTNKNNTKNLIIRTNSNSTELQVSQWNELIDSFKAVNPFYEEFYRNLTERKALQDIVTKTTFQKALGLIKALPEINCREFYPKSTKPSELKRNLGKLIALFNTEKGKTKLVPSNFKSYKQTQHGNN